MLFSIALLLDYLMQLSLLYLPEFLFIVLKTSTSIDPSPLNPYSKSQSSITLPRLINSD